MKRQISILLCFVLALTVISPIAIEQSKPKSAQAATAPVEQVCELEDLRTKTSETYLLSDGTRECVVYAENKYYEDAQGKLELIDNSIIETKYSFNKKEYHYQNAANETAVYFAEDEPAVLAVYGANALAYNLVGGNETSAAAGGSKKFSRVGEYSLCGNNYIAYHGVAEQTDFVFAVHNSGVKEYIVLGNDTAPSEFVFRFEHAGYSIKEVEYGRLGFFDEKGEQVFSLGSLYAVDAAGKYTDQVVYDLKEYDDTSAIIAITISDSYRQDPERVYPILIDPSVAMTGADQTYDTFVSSKFPNTNYFEDNHLRTGYDDDLYVRRTYIRFSMPSYLYSTTYNITDARIKIRQYIGTTPQAKAYRVTGSWTSGSLTWNNKPGDTATECSALATLDNDNWYNFVVTTIIKKQLNGTYGDYGVMLKDNTESGTQHWSTFYSSEAASPNKPELHITFAVYYGSRPYQSTSRTDINCMGYALEWADYITAEDLNLLPNKMIGVNKEQLQSYIAYKAEAWMSNNLGSSNYGSINTYNSSINFGWYRIILRVGFNDIDEDGLRDSNEDYDYHWWYQTITGDWADKMGDEISQLRSGTYNLNPATLPWPGYNLDYDSSGKFYQINDIRTITW